MSEGGTERLMAEYHETRQEHSFYREELLDMVDSGDQDAELWDEYWQAMKDLGRKEMRLSRKLRIRGVNPSSDGVVCQ